MTLQHRLAFALVPVLLLSNGAEAVFIRSPYVKEGNLAVVHKGRYAADDSTLSDGVFDNEFEVNYAVLAKMELELGARLFERPNDGDNYDLESTKVATKLQLTDKGAYAVDVGMLLAYNVATGSSRADEFNLETLFAHSTDMWLHTVNINLDKEVGENSRRDLELELEAQTLYQLDAPLQAGLEYYADFREISASEPYERQSHQIGPVINYRFTNGIAMQVGYLAGISKAADDVTLKWRLAYNF